MILEKTMPIPNSKETIKSRFCPLLLGGEYICAVSGGEDMVVYIYDVLRETPLCLNRLQGHSGTVLDISWNADETLLASCDSTGMVILWKRTKIVEQDD